MRSLVLLALLTIVGLIFAEQDSFRVNGDAVIQYRITSSPSLEVTRAFLAKVDSQFDLWKVHSHQSSFDVMVCKQTFHTFTPHDHN
jgi:hypothetical protein